MKDTTKMKEKAMAIRFESRIFHIMLPRTRLFDPVGGTRSQDMAAGPRGTGNSASSHEPRNQIVSPPIGRHPFAFNYRVPRGNKRFHFIVATTPDNRSDLLAWKRPESSVDGSILIWRHAVSLIRRYSYRGPLGKERMFFWFDGIAVDWVLCFKQRILIRICYRLSCLLSFF